MKRTNQLKIEYVPKESLKPYLNNAKIHTAEQIEQIKKSIEEFSFNDPIAIWKDNVIIEGHGRLLAVMEMADIEKVPVIRLDDLSDEQRKAYTLVHNKLTMNTDFDVELLSLELEDVELDMEQFGFEYLTEEEVRELDGSNYSQEVKIPQYEPTGEQVQLDELYDDTKTKELIEEIEKSEMPEEIRKFLTISAFRHTKFFYRKIAEYYANADERVQELMEKSALVIIDVEDAIANGYVKLSKTIEDIMDEK